MGAQFEFDTAIFQGAFADNGTQGKTNQVGVVKFDACAFRAVVGQDFDACGLQIGVELFGSLAEFGLVEVEADQVDVVGGDAERPDDAFLVVMLLYGNRHHARDANAVAAHENGTGHTLGIKIGEIEEFAILRAGFEEVA